MGSQQKSGRSAGEDREELVRALAHAKSKILRLQQKLAAAGRAPRSRAVAAAAGADQPPPDRLAVSDAAARRAAARAIAALAHDGLPQDEPWPGLGGLAGPAPLLAATASAGATMVANLRDPRILVGSVHDIPEPDLLVIPKADNAGELARAAAQIPARLWERLASGRTKLLLDACLEATPLRPEAVAELHRLLALHGARPTCAVYLTQDRGYAHAYERWRVGAGAEPMQVWTYDYYVQSLFLSLEQTGSDLFEAGLERWRALGPERERRFVSMNFHPRPTKLLFLLRLLRDGLWDEAFVSFAGFDWLRARGESPEGLADALLAMPELAALAREHLPWMEALERAGPRFLGAEDSADPKAVDRFGTVDLDEYRRSWFSVAAETEMGRRLRRITEKPFKPLVNFHPVLVLGAPGALKLIRAYGFETFDGLFDEGYDEEPDPGRRFELVYGQVLELCRIDEAALASRIAAVADRLVFNARWGMVELPTLFRRRIDRDMVSRLAAFVRGD